MLYQKRLVRFASPAHLPSQEYPFAKILGIPVQVIYGSGLTVEYVKYLFLREWNLIKMGSVTQCVNCHGDGKPCYHEGTTPGDLTLDVIDYELARRLHILTRSNIRVICNIANTTKGRTPAIDYDLNAQNYRHWESLINEGAQIYLHGQEMNQQISLFPA